MMDEQVRWRGLGRWLSFAVAALLVIAAIPDFATDDAAAGWNIFLGLLLFGVIASGSRRAPLLLLVLLGLMVVRLISALAVERTIISGVTNGAPLLLLFVAWLDLRKQAALMIAEGPAQAG